MIYPYPGDTTSGLMSAVIGMSSAYGDLNLLSSDITQAESQLAGAWTGPAAEKAKTDVGTLVTALPDLATRMNKASTAVQDLENTINGIQIQVDGLRTDHAKFVTELQGYQFSIGRAARFGEANDMTPAQIETYRSSLQADAKKVQGRLDDLDADYARLVRQANTATDHCSDQLKATYQVSVYRNSQGENVSLADGFGLSGLLVAHYDKMVADAAQFKTDVKGINGTNIDPAERQKRINALMTKYGADVTDPVFATAVANGEGPDYFRNLEASISNYYHGASGGSAPGQVALDKAFFTFNAQILATATNQANPEHVSTDYIKSMFGYSNASNVPEPGSIMGGAAYLSVGVPFPKAYLDTLGQYAISYEQSHLNAAGYVQPPWSDSADSRFLSAFGQGPFTNIGNNNDPLDPIMKQYAQNPDSSSALFSDAGGPDGKGDLYYLTHRYWPEGGGTDLSQAIVGETGPYAGNLNASAAIAGSFIHDVAQDTDHVPSQLHDAVGSVVGRYMGDVINAESPANGGLPGMDGATQTSGLDELDVAHAHFNPHDLPGALKFAYSDTSDTTVRSTLNQAWTKTAHQNMSYALQTASNELHNDPQHYSSSVVFNTAAGANRTLGLLTGSDISGFDSATDKAAEAAAQRKEILTTLASFVPVPEVAGLGHVASTFYDAGADFVKDTATSALAGTPSSDAAAHADLTTYDGLKTVDGTTMSTVTAMSKAGLPIVYDSTQPLQQTTVVVDSPTTPDAHLFTDPTTHRLLSLSEIEAKGTPATDAFRRWFTDASFTGGDQSATVLNAGQGEPFLAGLGSAAH